MAEGTRPATMSALTATTSAEQRKAAIAFNRLAVNLGMSLGPAVGGFLATVSFPLLFIVDGSTSIAAALVLSALLRSRVDASGVRAKAAPPTPDVPTTPRSPTSVWRDRNALEFLLAMFLMNLVFMQKARVTLGSSRSNRANASRTVMR